MKTFALDINKTESRGQAAGRRSGVIARSRLTLSTSLNFVYIRHRISPSSPSRGYATSIPYGHTTPTSRGLSAGSSLIPSTSLDFLYIPLEVTPIHVLQQNQQRQRCNKTMNLQNPKERQ